MGEGAAWVRHEGLHPAGILPLRLEGIGYTVRGRALLSDLTLTLRPGRRLVVLGPNGAGKSLLLRLCHGLIEPTSGRRVWADGSARPEAQAMVFQRPVLLRRTVAANIEFPLALRGIARAARRAQVAHTLERFGLTPLAHRPARLLSGGEQQRLALARAGAMAPQVLFLDEPCASLDPAATRIIEDMIMTLSAEGTTVMASTHDLGQARRLAQDVAFLNRGRLVEHGLASAFFAGCRTPEARAFLAGDLVC